jgi:hypothetical protein
MSLAGSIQISTHLVVVGRKGGDQNGRHEGKRYFGIEHAADGNIVVLSTFSNTQELLVDQQRCVYLFKRKWSSPIDPNTHSSNEAHQEILHRTMTVTFDRTSSHFLLNFDGIQRR